MSAREIQLYCNKMSTQKHYIIIRNQRYGYTLHPMLKVTRLVCRSANIEERFPNNEIPRILSELPSRINEHLSGVTNAQQTEVIRFRVSPQEREEIEDNAIDAGYDTLSAYLRDVSLHKLSPDDT